MTETEALARIAALRDRWQALLDEPIEDEPDQPTPRKVLERCTARLSEILAAVDD